MHYSGHVKRNEATGEVALRTGFPEGENDQMDNMAWIVSNANLGARHVNSAFVDAWPDLYVAEQTE